MASPGLAGRLVTRRTAARTYRRRSYDATPVPTARQLHVLNRLGYGFSTAGLAQVRAAGGAAAWVEQQLDPGSVPESGKARKLASWFPRLQDAPATIAANDEEGIYPAWEYARDLSNITLLRRIHTTRPLLENMVELWSNHLHVDANHFPGFTQRVSYDATIRRHALGRFDDLLVAATLHPAMLLYLDNHRSVRGNPNENHGRELLELHTVGVAAGYTEDDVKASARLLSGHTVDPTTRRAVYDPARHTTGAVHVLGFADPNTGTDPQLAERYVRHLAHLPAAATRVARRIAVRFVSDDPSPELVQHLASAYLASGTEIRAVLRALVASPEFWASAGRKVRTPSDDLVATCRALGVRAQAPTSRDSFAHALSWQLSSVLVYQWPRPDGAPDRAACWASTTRMLNSWGMHTSLAAGWWPRERVLYRRPVEYLPRKRIRFDQLVDHLSRVVLGRRSTARLLQAACEGCDVRPGEIVDRHHPVMRWAFVRLLAVLLDTPAHMTR